MRRSDLPALREPIDIRVDVRKNDQSYTIKAENPGAKKEDVRVLTRERCYGSMARGFTLACDVDDQASQAVFKDGVPTLTLPKRAQARGSVLQIS